MNDAFSEKLPCLPFQLEQSYSVVTTYKWDEEGFTCLVRKKTNKQLCILKYYTNPFRVRSLITEKKLLDSIHEQSSVFADSFPKVLELILQENEACFIREYIPGQTLEEICESNLDQPGIQLFQALDYVISTVELLDFLHSMKKPIIHRDIKPQNIVIDSEGKCHFIDMGISRFYQEGKISDTDSLGTRLTAPPEQFGYKQTDTRSDLYSAGVLLFYCLTGEYAVRQDAWPDIPEPVMRIILKATRFDPEQRYHNAGALMEDLLAVRYPQYMKASGKAAGKTAGKKKTVFTFVVAVTLMIAVFASGVFKRGSLPEKEIYTFQEPLLEAAVRKELGLSEDAEILCKELEKVTRIHIYGQQIYQDESELWYNSRTPWIYEDTMRESGLYQRTGSISSLEDIKAMPNLKELYLGKQQIEDISALKGSALTRLGLADNPVSDFEALKGNTELRALNLAGCEILSPDFLATLTNLSSLTLTAADIRTLEPLAQLPVKELELYEVVLPDYQELRYVPNLTSLSFQFFSREWLPFLEGLELERLILTNTSGLEIQALNMFPKLQVLYCGGEQYETVKLQGVQLPELRQLTLYAYTIEEFSALAGSGIARLEIYGSDVKDYKGLEEMEHLQEISCTKEQAEEIERQYPDHPWRLLYPQS